MGLRKRLTLGTGLDQTVGYCYAITVGATPDQTDGPTGDHNGGPKTQLITIMCKKFTRRGAERPVSEEQLRSSLDVEHLLA